MLTPRIRTAVRHIRRNIAAVEWHVVYDYVPDGTILSECIESSVVRGEKERSEKTASDIERGGWLEA